MITTMTEIKKKAGRLRAWFIVCLVLQSINFLAFVIQRILIYVNITEDAFIAEYFWDLLTLHIIKISFTVGCISDITKLIHYDSQNLNESPTKLIGNVKLMCCIAIGSVLTILLVSVIAQWLVIARIFGQASFGALTFIICTVMSFTLSSDIKYETNVLLYGSEEAYAEALSEQEKEKQAAFRIKMSEQQKQKEELALQKAQIKSAKLLDEIGIKFFVKYYDRLHHWSIPDVEDIIEENYSEQIKKERITTEKKLFASNLNVIALEIIVNNNNNLIDDDTRSKAAELLEKEKSTDK